MDQTTSEQTQQETSNLEATPAQDTVESTQASPQATEGKPAEATTKTEDSWEYTGDRNNVPDPFKKYASGFDRYVSKLTQSRAELEKKVREYEEKLNSATNSNKEMNTGKSAQPEFLATPEEKEAIMLGDTDTLEKVIERGIQKKMEAGINPKEKINDQKLQAIEMKLREAEAVETIKAFRDIHPDFDDLLKSPVGEFMVDAARRGVGLEQIYNSAKAAENYFSERIEAQRKAKLEEKKNGSVVGKSIAGEANTIFADTEDDAKRLAIQLQLKGDNRRVQVKERKK